MIELFKKLEKKRKVKPYSEAVSALQLRALSESLLQPHPTMGHFWRKIMTKTKKEKIERLCYKARCEAQDIAESIWVIVDQLEFTSATEFGLECRQRALDALSDGQALEGYGVHAFDPDADEELGEKDYEAVTAEVDAIYAAVEAGLCDHFYAAAWDEVHKDPL